MVKELFSGYKDLTLKMIEELKKDNDIDILMDKRMEILEAINKTDSSPEEKRKFYEELLIKEDDKALEKELEYMKNKVGEQIKTSKLRRQTTNSYAQSMRQPNLFSKKV